MAVSDENYRFITTITKKEYRVIQQMVEARRKEGYKATASGVGAELIRFALASRIPVRNE